MAEKVATAWPALRLARKNGLGVAVVVARVQQREHVLLRRVPTLDLVVATPISLVGVVGLAIAELVELARELLALLNGHWVAGLVWPLHLQRVARWVRSMNGRRIGVLDHHQLVAVPHNFEARLE